MVLVTGRHVLARLPVVIIIGDIDPNMFINGHSAGEYQGRVRTGTGIPKVAQANEMLDCHAGTKDIVGVYIVDTVIGMTAGKDPGHLVGQQLWNKGVVDTR